jgi:hypothetical protein
MSVFKKLKDVLFDVEEEEIPVITKEVKKEPIKEDNPIKEIKIPKEEHEVKKESNFNFPLDFDEKPMSRVKKDYDLDDDFFKERDTYKKEDRKNDYFNDYKAPIKEEPKKKDPTKPFTPTPIISPVYGILDQNYTKDDVIIKTDIGVKSPDLDEVRRKAYGLDVKKKETKKEEVKPKDDEEIPAPIKTLDEILADNEEKREEAIKLEEDEQKNQEKGKEKTIEDQVEIMEEPKKEEKKKDPDDTLETDLFNLIDSMYEDKKESEDEE